MSVKPNLAAGHFIAKIGSNLALITELDKFVDFSPVD